MRSPKMMGPGTGNKNSFIWPYFVLFICVSGKLQSIDFCSTLLLIGTKGSYYIKSYLMISTGCIIFFPKAIKISQTPITVDRPRSESEIAIQPISRSFVMRRRLQIYTLARYLSFIVLIYFYAFYIYNSFGDREQIVVQLVPESTRFGRSK